MKKAKYFIFLLLLILFPTFVLASDDIDSIKMEIKILDNGDALINETWETDVESGTEFFRGFNNLGKSKISDFKVSANNKTFKFDNNYDIDDNFSEKKYRNGFNYTDDGVELCFGKTKYGDMTYHISYKISNFVVNATDSQVVYWNLLDSEFSPKPEEMYIKIYSDFDYEDDLDVWGYGYGGYAYVYDGYIEMSPDNGLGNNDYMVVLIKFPQDTFDIVDNDSNEDFNYYYEMAQKGVEKNKVNIIAVIITVISGLIPFLLPVIVLAVIAKQNRMVVGKKRITFNKNEKSVKKHEDYFRQIPCDSIEEAYWISNFYLLSKNSMDVVGSLFLKWYYDGLIKITHKDETKADKNAILTLSNNPKLSNELEKKLYDMVYESSKDGILEKTEFSKYCTKNYTSVNRWFKDYIDFQTDKYIASGDITEAEQKNVFTMKKYLAGSSIYQKALYTKGLKNYLLEFSNIKDRTSKEVMLWKEYLMYAQIFGIADKIAKEFKKLYPDMIPTEDLNTIVVLNSFSTSGMNAARNRANSYSAGGGGHSSFGGGGGSFGGGGGGGSR